MYVPLLRKVFRTSIARALFTVRDDGGVSMPPLPRRPEFPVYALDDAWTGARWLEGWNWLHGPDPSTPAGNRLWEVVVCHGRTDRAPTVAVTTVARYERIALGDGVAVGPTGLADAALKAFLELLHRVAPADASERGWFREQMTGLQGPQELPFADEWTAATLPVDGDPVSFQRIIRGNCWAAAGNVGEVAVGLSVDGVDIDDIRLVAVDPTVYRVGIG